MICTFVSGFKSIKGFIKMGLREIRRHLQKQRQSAIRRFRKQKRLNSMASPGRHGFIVVLDHLKPAFKSLKIPQIGRVESLNVSIAASIVMYEYVRQNGGGF
jgi:hypothetical protein